MNVSLWLGDKEYRLNLVKKDKNELQVSIGKKVHRVTYELLTAEEVLLNIDGKIHSAIICSNTTAHSVCVNGRCFRIEKKSALQILRGKSLKQQKQDVKTSMPGKIIKVLVNEGDRVAEGQAVLILEAMKMQNEIKSPQAGQITRIVPRAGDSVEAGALLYSVE
ncbi:MAG: biotin/lipoyl-binding protein [Candidatus Aminicenantes bacterium]|jgi:biotin carboxyl carrier protein